MSGIMPKLGQYGTTVVSMFNPEDLVRGSEVGKKNVAGRES